uniref:WPP domain-containing protein n=1 Tax=Oryza glaberrima TaxID=4538 RepID=I1QBV8_ORYGL
MAEDAPSAAAAEGSQHASAAEEGSAAAAAPAAPAAKAAEALLPSLSIWPPSQRTRDAVVRRLVQTLAAPSILSQRYGAVPEAEAERAAAAVEAEAYAAVTESSSAAAAPASVEDGIEVLQAYSKEVSRRLLELAKSRAAPSPAAAAPAEGAASESEAAAAAAPAPVEDCYVVLNGIPVISAMFFHKCELTIKQDNCIFALAIPLTALIHFITFVLTEIGLGLSGFGVLFSFLGIIMLFDKGFLAIGNILFVSGVSLTIGPKSTVQFFTKPKNHKGSIAFGIGFFLVLIGWPFFGMLAEAYGFVKLFRGFWPTAAVYLQKSPTFGWIFHHPLVTSLITRFRGRRVPV